MRYAYILILAAAFSLAVSGCATASSNVKNSNSEQAKPMPGPSRVLVEAPQEPDTNIMECYVKVYDEKSFVGHSVILRPNDLGSVKFADMENVPEGRGANWAKVADSIEVGKCARALVFPQTNFRGNPQTLEPGYSAEDISRSPIAKALNSIKISCTCAN